MKEQVEEIAEENHHHTEVDYAKESKKCYLQENVICDVQDDTYRDA